MFCLPLILTAFVAVADGTVVEMDGLKSTTPATWKVKDLTPQQKAMRKNQFTIPKVDGDPEDAELVVFFFGAGQGGGVDENMKRWKAAFKSPAGENAKQESSKVGEVKVTRLDLEGIYLFKPQPFNQQGPTLEKPDFRMTGIVFESKNGPYFIRFVGPKKTIEASKEGFDNWLKGFK